MRVWITKVSSFNLNTRTRVKLHANACSYKISKFYTQLITRTVHEYYTQTTRILRACRCCNPFDRYCSSLQILSNLSSNIWVNLPLFSFLGPVIGLEFNGNNCVQGTNDVVKDVCSNSRSSIYVSSSPEKASQDIDSFYNFVDMSMN